MLLELEQLNQMDEKYNMKFQSHRQKKSTKMTITDYLYVFFSIGISSSRPSHSSISEISWKWPLWDADDCKTFFFNVIWLLITVPLWVVAVYPADSQEQTLEDRNGI